MNNRILKLTSYILILLIGIVSGVYLKRIKTNWSMIKKPGGENYIKFDDKIGRAHV